MSMTVLASRRMFVLALLAVPWMAAAQQARKPGTVATPPSSALPSYRQSSQQQQLRDKLQKSQLEERVRQNTADTAKRPSAGNAAQQQLLNQADQARSDRYRASQQDALDRYQRAVTPPPAMRRPTTGGHPASARSGG